MTGTTPSEDAAERLRRYLAACTDYEREAKAPPYDRKRFDLDRMARLVERLEHPELGRSGEKPVVVHVAGTKGKGSTSTMIASILRAAGLRVGLYTSPHLVLLGERIAIDGRPATADELGETFIGRLLPALAAATGERFTFFEVLTALAFLRFAEASVDAAVYEVGLGGRLDSTNVVAPDVAVVTSIGLDHTAQLGTTLGAVAREKAGIAKARVPLIIGTTVGTEADAAIREVARSRGAARIYARGLDFGETDAVASTAGTDVRRIRTWRRVLKAVHLRLIGRHQAENAAVAVAAVEALDQAGRARIADDAVMRGLADAFIPARFQIVEPGGGRSGGPGDGSAPAVVVDGAHNPDSVERLVDTVREVYPRAARPALDFGAMRDKDVASMVAEIGRLAPSLAIAPPIASPRAIPPEEMALLLSSAGIKAAVASSTAEAIADARRAQAHAEGGGDAREPGLVLVCGSLYLAGDALSALGMEMLRANPKSEI